MDEDRNKPADAGTGGSTEEPKEFLPPCEFGSIIIPFYTQTLVKLGLMEDPLKGETTADLKYAKRLIDLLDLLKERTKGALQEEEGRLLESCLVQLKMHYMQKADILRT
jgi:hypothetical protein